MRTTALFLFLLIGGASIAQTAPKNTRSILVTVNDADSAGIYKLLAAHLIDQGYTLAKTDKDLGIINTERRAVKGAIEVRISTSIRNNVIRFTGKQFLPGFDSSESDIVNYGMKGSMNKVCFNELEKVSLSFPNKNVKFE